MRRTTLTLVVISLIFVAFVLYSLLHLEPIHVTGGRLEHLGGGVVVRGIATNTASDAQAAGIKVVLYDSAGHKVAAQTLSLKRLAPGQSVAFQSRPINASRAEKFTIQVDRGANMYGN
jgi:hypothetical protein